MENNNQTDKINLKIYLNEARIKLYFYKKKLFCKQTKYKINFNRYNKHILENIINKTTTPKNNKNK